MHLVKGAGQVQSRGLSELNIICLIQAFIISKIVYTAPFLQLTKLEKDKLNALIRRVYKQALGIPNSAPTYRLMEMEVHNTIDELIEAHRMAQRCRLSKTNTGRRLLERMGMTSLLEPGEMDLPSRIRHALRIQHLPKNMHALQDVDRRKARTKHLTKQLKNDPHVWYTDASPYPHRRAHCAVAITFPGDSRVACTIRSSSITAEEAAIALAIAHLTNSGTDGTGVSDSQAAIRNYIIGRIQPETQRILATATARDSDNPTIKLIWTPAPSELEGNG